nr:Rib/alpha-like domain-containing protein [Streptococcus sp. O1]
MGDTPAPANSLESVPAGSQVAYKTPVDTSTPGDQSTTVVGLTQMVQLMKSP